jgi:hypothetical protein
MSLRHPKYTGRHQRGMTTVIVAILLLLIVSIVVLFSSSVSVREVKTGAAQSRSTQAMEAAQQGLNLGLEFIRVNRAVVASDSTGGWFEAGLEQWEPCRSIPSGADQFPCDAEPNAARRANLFRYRGPTPWTAANRHRMPIPQPAALPARDIDGDGDTETSDPALRYGVGALMCLIFPDDVPEAAAGGACDRDPIPGSSPPAYPDIDCINLSTAALRQCAIEHAQAYAIRVVSRGAVMSADAAANALPEAVASGVALAESRSSVSHTYGSFRLIADGPESPLIAVNSVRLRGTFDIVANPNAGGFGIPLSIWTSAEIDPNGTPKSCHLQEFLLTGTPTVTANVPVCTNCECPREGSLSYKDTGTIIKGNDIVDATGNSQVQGARNFPPDMFQYMFGVPRIDAAGNPRWQDVRERAVRLTGTGCTASGTNPKCCSDLNAQSTGLFWSTEATCSLANNRNIGSPAMPVFIVVEGGLELRSDVTFGVIYKFQRPGDTTTYNLTANGGTTVYGALIADGNASVFVTGTSALVYHQEIMENLVESPGLLRLGPMPGTWTDLSSY